MKSPPLKIPDSTRFSTIKFAAEFDGVAMIIRLHVILLDICLMHSTTVRVLPVPKF